MIHRPQRYSRTDPWPQFPFAPDAGDVKPPVGEVMFWLLMAAVIVAGLAACLGIE